MRPLPLVLFLTACAPAPALSPAPAPIRSPAPSPTLAPLPALAPSPPRPPAAPPALLLRNATLYTLDPSRPRATTAVIERSRFTCVGSETDCASRAPRDARVLDLHGGSATPGLADAHGHVAALGQSLTAVELRGATSEAECVSRLAARAHAPGLATGPSKDTWIVGHAWDQTRWPDQRMPTEEALSHALPDQPVLAVRVDGHAVWLNARALALAGITAATRDPAGGRIERYPDGRPSGVLVDNAQDLAWLKLPSPSPAQIEQALVAAMDRLVEAGLTSVHDAGVDPATLAVYSKLAGEDRLKLRIYAMLRGAEPMNALRAQMAIWKRTPEVGWLTVRAVKLYADGALGSRGALLFEPYADDPSTSGLAVTPAADLRERILAVAEAGYQPAVHAIGDRACAETLADFVEASKLAPDLRPRVEHLQILRARDAHLLVDARAVASMQPTHATSDGPWAEARLGHGTERQKGAYAWRRVLDAGVPLACGSDFPVEDIDPRAGLYSAETRRWSGGPPQGWMPEQRMTREEALRCFTRGAAYAEHAEARRGMIKEGYDADVTVFAGDVFGVSAEELKTLPVVLTLVGGRVEYTR